VHGTPFLAIVTAITPAMRRTHAIPLIVHVGAGIPGVCNVSGGDGVRRSDGITWGRRYIASGSVIRDGRKVGIDPAEQTLRTSAVGRVQGIITAGARPLAFGNSVGRRRSCFSDRGCRRGGAAPTPGKIAGRRFVADIRLGNHADAPSQQFCFGGSDETFGVGGRRDVFEIVRRQPFTKKGIDTKEGAMVVRVCISIPIRTGRCACRVGFRGWMILADAGANGDRGLQTAQVR